MRHTRSASLVVIASIWSCTGPAGPAGPEGPAGSSPDAGAPTPVIGTVSSLELPASAPYPSSISAAADGSLFVGGLLGQIVKFVPTSTHAALVIPQVGPPGTVLANLIVDQAGETLYACGDLFHGTPQNPFASPAATLYAYDLAGQMKATYALPNQGSSLCEDLEIGPSGDVYITDPFTGSIYTIAAPVTSSSAVTVWASSSVLLADPSIPVPPFGAHGITVAGSNVYVSNFSTSALYRIPIRTDGTADLSNLTQQTAAISNPERLIALDSTHLLVSEDVWCGPGRLTELTQSATDPDTWSAAARKTNILGATSATVANGSYYTVESQVCQIVTQLAGGPAANPILPFWIDRIDAD